jgi:imidazolonepropionase-like amidohydrolase
MRLLGLLLLSFLVFKPAAAGTLYVRAGKLVDVEAGRVLRDQLVQIENDRIVAVSPWSPPPANAQVIDWSGFMVLPGLIDLHTHLLGDIQSANIAAPLMSSAADDVLLGVRNARITLLAGFTTVRDVGCWRALSDVLLRNAINAGTVDGPRMSVVGAYLTIPGGGGDITGLAPDIKLPEDMQRGIVTNVDDMRTRSRWLLQHGVDGLKLIATGAVLTVGTDPGQPELSEAQMRAAVEEAAKYGKYVASHAHGAEGIKQAIRAGVRTIEHGSIMDDEGLHMMKQRGTWLVADIYNGDYIDAVGTKEGWPAETLRKNRDTTITQREVFRKAVKLGVNIAFGTDAGVYPHGQNARQFAYMVKYGMTPMQAIQSATLSAAVAMGWRKDVGSISAGHYADMIAIDGDALDDITLLMKIRSVMKGGVLVK